ncbi:MAG: DUF2975 domain-containing protein [Acidobacteriaceae bacterium]
MRPEVQAKLQKIKKVSTLLRAICKVLLALITFTGLGAVVSVIFGVGGINYNNVIFETAGLPIGHRLFLGVVTALAFGVLFKCVYHLHRLFGNYSRGEIFTRESVGQLRQFGIACLLWGVVGFLWISSLAISSHPSKTFQGHADSLGIGVVIIVIAWFMDMAVDLREENDLTI